MVEPARAREAAGVPDSCWPGRHGEILRSETDGLPVCQILLGPATRRSASCVIKRQEEQKKPVSRFRRGSEVIGGITGAPDPIWPGRPYQQHPDGNLRCARPYLARLSVPTVRRRSRSVPVPASKRESPVCQTLLGPVARSDNPTKKPQCTLSVWRWTRVNG